MNCNIIMSIEAIITKKFSTQEALEDFLNYQLEALVAGIEEQNNGMLDDGISVRVLKIEAYNPITSI